MYSKNTTYIFLTSFQKDTESKNITHS